MRIGGRKTERLPLEDGEGEGTKFDRVKQTWGDWNFKPCNKREGNIESCNCDFQRVFDRKGLGLGFMVELNLYEVA